MLSCRRGRHVDLLSYLFEIQLKVGYGLITFLSFLSKGLVNYPFQLAWCFGCLVQERRRLMVQDRYSRVTVSPTFERRLASNHFIQNDAQTENVGTRINRFTFGLLWRHVARRANNGT